LICAVLLKDVGVVDRYIFVHPKDIQDGKIVIDENDVLANVPYFPGCGLWFDHHVSESDVSLFTDYKGASKPAKSCARIVYDYYGGKQRFPDYDTMMIYVDKCDSGDLTIDEILEPKGWVLLSFVMDPRTGLGRYKDYRVSNYALMESLIEMCRKMTIEEILAHSDVQERTKRYLEQAGRYRRIIETNSRVDSNCLIIDLRKINELPVGNRFIEYSLFPRQNISIRAMQAGPDRVAFAVGHSIINRSSRTNVGMLLKNYGGGGHSVVGTCQVPNEQANNVLDELVEKITADG